LTKISPGTIIAAAFITQIAVLLIVLLGSIFRPSGEDEDRSWRRPSNPNGPIFGYLSGASIITLLILGMSDAFIAIWLPITRDVQLGGIPWETAILWVWILDILLLGLLVDYTGGCRTSPFTSLFFVFPTIALFLHESGLRLIIYTSLVVILFTINILKSREEDPPSILSFWLVSVASFVLTTTTGFITRQ
jgi:hypothetical protein